MKKTHRAKPRNEIGNRVKEARLRCKPPVSQEDLAGRLAAKGVLLDRSAVSRIESRARYIMDYEISAIAAVLKTSVAALFGKKGDLRVLRGRIYCKM